MTTSSALAPAARRPAELVGAGPFFGREKELDTIGGLLARAREGLDSHVMVFGEFGGGKTALLDAAARRARAQGFTVAIARGARLEVRLAGGIVHQLSDALLEVIDSDGTNALPAPVRSSSEFDALESFQLLVRTAAARRPLFLAVDDVHLADAWSMRCLAYARPRLTGHRVVIATTANRGLAPLSEISLPELTGTTPEVIELGGLDLPGVSGLVRAATGRQDAGFAAVCREVTGGNPYLLRSLVSTLQHRSHKISELTADQIRAISVPLIGEILRVRLRGLPGTTDVARAVAVLGEDATLEAVGALAGLSPRVTLRAVDTLVRLHVLADSYPPAFTYSYVRNGVLDDMCVAEQAASHATAARLLFDAGVPDERVAAHLLEAGPIRLPWGVEVLRRAARRAVHQQNPDLAGACLRRALDERLPPDRRLAVQLELGHVEFGLDRSAGRARLRDALAMAEDPGAAAEVAETMVLGSCGDAANRLAISVATEVIARLGSAQREVAQRLRYTTYLAAAGGSRHASACAKRVFDDLRAEIPENEQLRRIHALLVSLAHAREAGSHADFLRYAAEALNGDPIPAFGQPYVFALFSAALADEPEHAEQFRGLVEGMREPHDYHLRKGIAASLAHGMAIHLLGDLPKARTFFASPVRMFLDSGAANGCPMATLCLAWYAEVLVDLGRLDEATAMLSHVTVGELFPDVHLLFARGKLRLAGGDGQGALDDLTDCGRRLDERGVVNPAVLAWREHAVRAHLLLGDREQAAELAAENLRLARQWGTPRVVGTALLAVGISGEDGDDAEHALQSAIESLSASPAKLRLAEALFELGSLLRRRGHPEKAVPQLRRALDLTAQCAAEPLSRLAGRELRSCEAALSETKTSTHGLTRQESRVAAMAVQGLTNRQIADALHLTRRTVELHLSGAYRKLGISGRADLSSAFPG
ncbi:AAA family ATPase [Amycolatopsis sp. YIM 10]|uniref:AAA family ATPase n=1 Tax=Amycolatopsis sp. YIM 10 TaxID=2653857 RepID=UPI0012AA4C92|nr:AAA family ATPase [Amycolatopsis sp. YIM 10]QFU93515.1 Bacterial regulatory protein, LuxR family [Amycolatopsis sp. YIM 10]